MSSYSNQKRSDIREWTVVIAFLLFVLSVCVLKEVKKSHASTSVQVIEKVIVSPG